MVLCLQRFTRGSEFVCGYLEFCMAAAPLHALGFDGRGPPDGMDADRVQIVTPDFQSDRYRRLQVYPINQIG